MQCNKSCCPSIESPSVIYANKAYTGQRCKTSYRLFGEYLQVFEHLAWSEFEVSFSSRVHYIFLQIWQCCGNKYWTLLSEDFPRWWLGRSWSKARTHGKSYFVEKLIFFSNLEINVLGFEFWIVTMEILIVYFINVRWMQNVFPLCGTLFLYPKPWTANVKLSRSCHVLLGL